MVAALYFYRRQGFGLSAKQQIGDFFGEKWRINPQYNLKYFAWIAQLEILIQAILSSPNSYVY